MAVRFVLDGQPVLATDVDPCTTLLQWLRASGRTAVKEGCAEGECGACAVAVAARDGHGRATFESVNSCLAPLFALEGRAVVTSEGVSEPGGVLHAVQQAMVEHGGSQCGYCTPGFVVSLFCEYYRPGRSGYDPEAISGNLCRCTGYRPIVEAARSMSLPRVDDPWVQALPRLAPAAPSALPVEESRHGAGPQPQDECFTGGGTQVLRPKCLSSALQAIGSHPKATLVAGGTDLIVAANQRGDRWAEVIALDAVAELRSFRESSGELTLGACLTLSQLEEHLAGCPVKIPLLEQLLPLFSSRLIRNRATLGGNLATASPIGDSAPVLLALDAQLSLASAGGTRRVALADFFRSYRRTALGSGELIESICVPLPVRRYQRFYKVSRRVLDDISTVAGAFALDLDGSKRVAALRVAFGGVAATPLRLRDVERVAQGRPWNPETLAILHGALEPLVAPITDHRGSAAYRKAMTHNLLERFFVETTEATAGES